MTDIARLTALAAGTAGTTTVAPSAPPAPPVQPARQFYIYINGASVLKTEPELIALLATDATLKDAPVVLSSESASGWKTAAVYNLQAPAAPSAPAIPPPPAPVVTIATVVAPTPVLTATVETSIPTNVVTIPTQTTALATVNSDAEAEAMFALMVGGNNGMTMGEAFQVATAGTGQGMSHTLPFAQLKSGNWDVHKDVAAMPGGVADYLPAGKRDWTAIYLAYRLGGTGWIGAGSKASGGSPPAWRFALPTVKGNADAPAFISECLKHARNLQYTKGEERVKFDVVGRLSPELHVLCWKPNLGFCLLVVTGYTTVTKTQESLNEADTKGLIMAPLSFRIQTEHQENKKVMRADPTAKNAAWDEDIVTASADGSEKGLAVRAAWMDYLTKNKVAAANELIKFAKAEDFNGLPLPEVEKIFLKLNDVPVGRR